MLWKGVCYNEFLLLYDRVLSNILCFRCL